MLGGGGGEDGGVNMVFLKNKRGWIRVVEALTAILLLAGVFLVAINQGRGEDTSFSERIQNSEAAILRDIQLNNTLRAEIIATSGAIEWDSGNFPAQTKAKIIEKTPDYLNCTAKICATGDLCLPAAQDKTIYAESVIITSTLQTYNPRQIKLFCWEK